MIDWQNYVSQSGGMRMNKRSLHIFAFLIVLLISHPALAQRGGGEEACAACGGTLILVIVLFFVLNIALLVWVARDAKARGMDNAVLWMLLVMFTGIIGLIIYIFSRPKGNLIQCPSCNNKRLQASARCPHCGNA